MKQGIPIYLYFFFALFSLSLGAWETDIDYNYEYQKNGPYTKFSDWVPYKLHKWEPKYLEDFYELYNLKQHYNDNELRKNIYWLKIALNKRFRHPKHALCETKTEQEYYKYRNLMFMHINIQIMRSYMRIASKFDKRHVYFYNLDFAHELKESFGVAESFYKEAIPYWEKAKEYADKANEVPVDLDLGTIETERYEIVTGKLDFGHIIENHLDLLDGKKKIVSEYLAKYPEADAKALDLIDRQN
ncbi:hypothetical protein [Leptospira bouyouniensis]|uniref:Uncharacterized protein n=1 Tax=Leptospira bouyouniensis TaxID=2484911 RepID=A0A7I0IKA0_9LEPT|nr:hypothetical protein [Leptospira bouyouniensis]TGK47279.1 hypothetical protein EHQ10_18405 [Leptospira bouyouniensis]TGL03458.1 hypothetical protein EHQ43_16970 [Leptospira bouyouniensis]TGM80388.1 hypothetical protein EHQ99_11940 [Leptospira bouyouniensis]